jgi:hypothetical protein
MKRKWIPKKSDVVRVVRARKAKALRAERRGKAMIEHEASRLADAGIEALVDELGLRGGQGAHSASGKRQ